jgi:hypothetical protein
LDILADCQYNPCGLAVRCSQNGVNGVATAEPGVQDMHHVRFAGLLWLKVLFAGLL